MKKITITIIISLSALVLAFPALATERPKGLEDRGPLTKKTFIHYKKGYAKPPWAGGGKPKEDRCYGFLSKGAKLKSVKDLTVHPDLDSSAIFDSASEWDSHISQTLFGSYVTDPGADWDSVAPDGRNELSYGNYSQDGVIAVTVAWGYFSGPPPTREIVEFDILFDTDYVWGDAGEDDSLMDLQNIATHEIGHGVGLGDVYESSCSEVTMYGYSTEGEIKKRDLHAGDIAGLEELYK